MSTQFREALLPTAIPKVDIFLNCDSLDCTVRHSLNFLLIILTHYPPPIRPAVSCSFSRWSDSCSHVGSTPNWCGNTNCYQHTRQLEWGIAVAMLLIGKQTTAITETIVVQPCNFYKASWWATKSSPSAIDCLSRCCCMWRYDWVRNSMLTRFHRPARKMSRLQLLVLSFIWQLSYRLVAINLMRIGRNGSFPRSTMSWFLLFKLD